MKYFEVMNLEEKDYKVVLSTSYVSPLSEMVSISNKLDAMKYKGDVIFDLLLSNGFATNRFIKMNFDGEKLIYQTTEVLEKPSSDVLAEIYDFYAAHPEYIEKSSLPDAHRYLLKNNLMKNSLD